jgi:hypothetical protein
MLPPASAAPRREEEEGGAMATAVGFPRDALSALPVPLQQLLFSLLPVDARARCAAVCRGWRDALREACLWRVLDFSPSSGVTCSVTDEAVAGAAAKAAGAGLLSLDVSERRLLNNGPLRQVVTAHAATLRVLRVASTPDVTEAIGNPTRDALLMLAAVAPQLRELHTSVRLSAGEALQLLRGEAPFEAPALRLHALVVLCHIQESVLPLTEALSAPPPEEGAAIDRAASLTCLSLIMAPLEIPGALDAVVDVALARRLRAVTLAHANLSALAAPALVRLLRGPLTQLRIVNRGQALPDAEAAALLAAALRANDTLTHLSLQASDLWADPAVALALLAALTGHGSVRTLSLARNRAPRARDDPAACAALAALVSADAPALTALDVSDPDFGPDEAAPLFDALRVNSHLRRLTCIGNLRDAFVRDVALPALRANTRLEQLLLEERSDDESEEEEEEAPAWDDDYADDHISSADEDEEEEAEAPGWIPFRPPARDEAPWAAVRRETARRRRAAATAAAAGTAAV